MHDARETKAEQTLDFNVQSQHGYRARGRLLTHEVIIHEMSIGQSNMYIISHEVSNTKYG